MPVLEKQKRGIHAWKTKLIPGAPDNLANFVLPPVYSHTITGNRHFYRYIGAGQTIVILGTDRDLLRLAAADFWLGDGFHSIPLYEQVSPISFCLGFIASTASTSINSPNLDLRDRDEG